MTWVKLIFLEAQLRPVEQLDKRPPWKAEGRTMQEQLSRRRDWVLIIRDMQVTKIKRSQRVGKNIRNDLRIKPFFAVKNFGSERHFLDTLFCC
ncbi:MAG: hypothetical protein ACJASL_002156 [Paraglaciecola sp.]|jgi:hypothetical protein